MPTRLGEADLHMLFLTVTRYDELYIVIMLLENTIFQNTNDKIHHGRLTFACLSPDVLDTTTKLSFLSRTIYFKESCYFVFFRITFVFTCCLLYVLILNINVSLGVSWSTC